MTNKLSIRLFILSAIAAFTSILVGVLFLASAQFRGTAKANNSILTESNSTQKVVGEKFKFTEQQSEEIFSLIKQHSNQMNAVLTPSQQEKFRQALKSGQKYNQALQSLSLTAEQNQRIGLINNETNLKVKLMGTEQQ